PLVPRSSARVFTHSHMSSAPCPIVLEPFSLSYPDLFFSYSSRVIPECHLFEFDDIFEFEYVFELMTTAVLAFAFRIFALEFDGVSHALNASDETVPTAINVKSLRFIFPSCLLLDTRVTATKAYTHFRTSQE